MPWPETAPRPVVMATVVFVLGVQLYLASSLYLNHDVAWSLTAATRVIEGARLYEDVLELNPPLFIVLAMPAAWVAKATGAFAPLVLLVFLLALTLGSLALSGWVLRRLDLRLGADAVLATFTFLLVPFALPLYGQREHLFALFWTPYVLLAALRGSGREVRPLAAMGVGAFAGVGIALKPFFILPCLAVEGYLAVRRRRLRLHPALLAAAFVVAAYVGAVLALWPGYFGTIVPLARATYWAYNNPLREVLMTVPALLALLALVAASLVRVRGEVWRALRGVFWASTAGSLAGALVQSKGWNYQLYPALVTGSLLLLVVALSRLPERRDRAPRRGVGWLAPAGLCLASLGGWAIGLQRLHYMHREAASLVPVLRECGGTGSVAFLSTDIDPAFPAVTYTDLQWNFRYAALWPLPAIVRQRHEEATRAGGPRRLGVDETERFLISSVVTDLERRRPDLLVVDKRRHKQALDRLPFDFVEYFSRGDRFRAVMAEYHLLRQVAGHDVYGRLASTRCPALAARAN